MKKILVAAALAFIASSASALIANSRHDFQTNGYVSPVPASACLFCHTPHGASTVAGTPLWARNVITPTAYYVGSTINAINNTSVSVAGVQTCLGCHSTGAAADMGTTSSLPAGNLITGTDLSNDHPVGNDTLFGSPSLRASASISLGGFSPVDNQTLSCAGCHDVHNTNSSGANLLRSYTGDFCNTCHDK